MKKVSQRLPIALAQIRTGNTSENVLNEIWQNNYSLNQGKKLLEKNTTNTMNMNKV